MKKWILFLVILFANSVYSGSMPAFLGSLKHATVGNADIAYYRFGSGKPLVMITGHGDAMSMWHPDLLKKLSDHRELIIFDYPGIDASTIKGEYPSSMSQLATLVQGFIDGQKLDKPDVLGFSMGGSLLLYMATQNSAKYDHIIAVGGKAGGKKSVAPDPKNFNMLSEPGISPAVAIKTLLFPASAGKQADAYLQILSQFPTPKMNGDALKAQAKAVSDENNGDGIWSQLTNIQNKTLILSGTEDLLSPVQNAVMIASGIPGAWLIQIQGAGHGVLFQEPDYTSKIIELFLNY